MTRRTILVVDDTPEDIAILHEELKEGYRVQAATDHEAAERILHSGPTPDLILLDILMPGMDGYQLCRELKSRPSTKDIPVIFVTVKDAVENEAAGFEAGCVDYIAKPFNPALLKARVKAHIDLKLAREELKKQNDILVENARLREEVDAISRHDLKNPLMIVLNVPGVLLADPGLTEHQRQLLLMVDNAGRQMLEMINKGIDMQKMERGAYPLTPVRVDVVQPIERIRTALKTLLEERGVTCALAFPGAAPAPGSFFVLGEELLVFSMLANLIRNAVEASPPGGQVTISLREGERAVISVHNFGAIPEHIRDRFFEKFTTAGKEKGTGLGAYSARLTARTLGGSISFETSEETGTTLTVNLPRA